MFIISMGAGLGNQMFEYAFYTHLKMLYPLVKIKVDTEFAFPKAHNGIEIFDIFGVSAEKATKAEVLCLTSGYGLNGDEFKCSNIVEKIWKKLKGTFTAVPHTMKIQDDFTEYYEDFFDIEDGQSVYFLGPFANYHYFSSIQNEIKNIYKFPIIEDERNKCYASMIENCDSISIHVRKGDYSSEGIELTSPLFYNHAISEIEKKVEDAKYFVFTDDVVYAKKIFPDEESYVVVEGNTGKNSFRDMQLMSMCKHNITANSTFSFWGAFLNSNPNKIVIAPNLAFTGSKYPFVCDEWILI